MPPASVLTTYALLSLLFQLLLDIRDLPPGLPQIRVSIFKFIFWPFPFSISSQRTEP